MAAMAESICSEGVSADKTDESNVVDSTCKLAEISLQDEILTKFRCQGIEFSLSAKELTKIPYLEVLSANAKDLKFKEKPGDDGVISLDETFCKAELMQVVIKYIKTGRARCLFSDLPGNSDASSLFQLLDYLCVEKPNHTLAELNKDLKNTYSVRDKHGNCIEKEHRSRARDACVELCWIGCDLVGPKEQSKLYNLVLYIQSHPRTFYLPLRRATLNWYMEYFKCTDKQKAILQKWLKDCPYPREHYEYDDKSSSGGSDCSDGYCYSSEDDSYYDLSD